MIRERFGIPNSKKAVMPTVLEGFIPFTSATFLIATILFVTSSAMVPIPQFGWCETPTVSECTPGTEDVLQV